jgi:hypothetical protein
VLDQDELQAEAQFLAHSSLLFALIFQRESNRVGILLVMTYPFLLLLDKRRGSENHIAEELDVVVTAQTA